MTSSHWARLRGDTMARSSAWQAVPQTFCTTTRASVCGDCIATVGCRIAIPDKDNANMIPTSATKRLMLLFMICSLRVDDVESDVQCRSSLSFPLANSLPTPFLCRVRYEIKLCGIVTAIRLISAVVKPRPATAEQTPRNLRPRADWSFVLNLSPARFVQCRRWEC